MEKSIRSLDINKMNICIKKIDLKIDKINLLKLINRNDKYGKYAMV